jgi:hypothetical protein
MYIYFLFVHTGDLPDNGNIEYLQPHSKYQKVGSSVVQTVKLLCLHYVAQWGCVEWGGGKAVG